MAQIQPLIDSKHSLSLGVVTRLKSKTHHWKELSHEHALDHAMAVGFRDMHTGKVIAKHWGKRDGDAETPGTPPIDLQTNTEAVTNLLNNCLGSGVLAVPFAMKNLGIAVAVPTLMVSAILNRHSLLLILKCCDIAGVETSYNKLGTCAFGQCGRLLVVFCFVIMGFGCLVSYVDATTDSLGGLLQDFGSLGWSTFQVQMIALIMLFPPTYIRSLKSIAPLSMIAFIGALVVVACVGARCGMILYHEGFPAATELKLYETDPSLLFSNIPTCLTVFSIQAGGSIILSTLKDHSESNKGRVATITKVIAFIINLSVGLPAYLCLREGVKPDVLSSFVDGDPVIVVAKIAVLDMVVLSYMFMMIPCRVALIELFFRKNEAKQEASWGQFLAVTTAVNFAAMGVGMLVSDLSIVIGLIGAVAVNLIAFILPSAIYIKVRANPKMEGLKPVPVKSAANLPYFALILLSAFLMVSGLTTIVMNTLAPEAADLVVVTNMTAHF